VVTGEGFSLLQYNPAMPAKNIVTGQHVTKEKLQRATPALAGGAREELRREITPAERILWEELPPSGTFGGRINWESILEGNKLYKDSSSIFTVTRWGWRWRGLVGGLLCPSDISPKYDNEKLGCE